MRETLYQRILESAVAVDRQFALISSDELHAFKTSFVVPSSHARSKMIERYDYVSAPVSTAFGRDKTFVLVDNVLQSLSWMTEEIPATTTVHWLVPNEKETKECGSLDRFYAENIAGKQYDRIVAIGGGIVINAASYLAEKEQCSLAYVPTTVLAMADAAIGGKVRANVIENGACRKHAYKSWYEPDIIVVEPRFLETIPDAQVSVGMGEIIKQGVYQSRPLLDYLATDEFDPFHDRVALLRSILWAAALAANCLNVDPDESKDGSHIIMRGAHDASDKIEEASCFRVPHGIAVAQAIRHELIATNSLLVPIVEKCMRKLQIPFAS
jgi:3-dehydroquinate synthetase